LSEPPEIRRQIEQQARAELIKAGADDKVTTVTVLSAYKQGYSWLYDVVRPALEGKGVDQITIKFAEIGPPAGWTQQGMYAPTRWLLEIYPIDEILAGGLHEFLDFLQGYLIVITNRLSAAFFGHKPASQSQQASGAVWPLAPLPQIPS